MRYKLIARIIKGRETIGLQTGCDNLKEIGLNKWDLSNCKKIKLK